MLDLLKLLGDALFITHPSQPYGVSNLVNSFGRQVASEVHEFVAEYDGGQGITSVDSPTFGAGRADERLAARKLSLDPQSGTLQYADQSNYALSPGQTTVPLQIANFLRSRIYAFRAERLQIGASAVAGDATLQPNAANLAQVLNRLQSGNPARWARYVGFVRTVLPHVTQVTVPPIPGTNNVQILVWSVDPGTEREDLAVPLSQSGTGISQVLAILYVVVTADVPRTILIDEPQSFLHPGAVRKLFDILRLHPQHQYVVTTHSPSAVTAAAPQALLLVHAANGESTVENLSAAETRDLRTLLHEVGARLSDVFGADRILWVEGRTEEVCFPLIMVSRTDVPVSATAVLGVRATGDFERRDATATFELYERLTHGPRLLPPAVGFVFDREDRAESVRADLRRRSGGKVRFTQRRMYESYLLRPEALAAVMREIAGFSDTDATAEDVSAWIEGARWDRRYFKRAVPEGARSEEFWQREVDAAKLLTDLFPALSGQRVRYDKVRHGYSLTAWLCEHAPGDLDELGNTIAELMSASAGDGSA